MTTTKIEFNKQELELLSQVLLKARDDYRKNKPNDFYETSKNNRKARACQYIWNKVDLAIANLNGMPF